MTTAQKVSIKNIIQQKYDFGEITPDEYLDLMDEVDTLAKVGASKQDAMLALGLAQTSGTAATANQAAPASSGGFATQEDYIKAKKQKYQDYKNGLISGYAYAKWKKQNDPSLNGGAGAAGAASPGTTASVLDPGTMATQQAAVNVEKQLTKVYKKAQKELKEKLNQFTAAFQAKDALWQQKLAKGEVTQAQYDSWKQGQVFQSNIWKQKIDQVTGVLADANAEALQIINGEKMGVFAENANYTSYQIDQDAKMDISFAVYDEDAVGNLLQNQPELMPRKIINGKKDKAWNQKKIANAVAQSIIQGESLPKLAARIASETASDNNKAMMRYAHTALTGAQNAGRMHTMQRALGMGIKCKKCWLATLDGHTRDSHQALDGQVKPVNEPFQSPLGKIMYPGDPNAESQADVWNCRCTLTYEYEDFPNDPEFDTRRDNTTGETIQNMTYQEWKAAKEGSALNDLNAAKVELAKAQKDYIAGKVDESHVYHNIWKDDVTVADYPAKKGSIQAKRDYYKAEIDKIKNAQAAGESWATDEKLKEKKKLLSELNKFEKQGKLYEARQEALKKVQDIYRKVGYGQTAQAPQTAAPAKAPKKAKAAAGASGVASGQAAGQTGAGAQPAGKKGQFEPDAWDDRTKKAAVYYDSRVDADKPLRKELDALWGGLTEDEKYAVWEYTHNSNPMNKRLSGYGDTTNWSRSDFVGFGNTVWGLEDTWRGLPREMTKFGENGHPLFHKAIKDLTKAIDKSELGRDMWFKREGGPGDFAGMMEGGGFKFEQIFSLLDGTHSQAELDAALVGQRGKNNAFTSVGIAKDAIWGGNVWYNIYAPKGTKGIYAEPQSHYGQSMGGQDKIYKKGSAYSGVGSEAEVIMQRGTEYRILAVRQKLNRWGSPSYEVDMEVVGQPDYFVHGDEDTYNDGKTRHKK